MRNAQRNLAAFDGMGFAHEKGRGREADVPTQIPTLGWKDIAWRIYEEFGQDRVMSVAAGVTYYALLALFPAIAALVSIYGLFADPVTIQDQVNTLAGVLPGGALDIVREQVTRIASKGNGALGESFAISLGLSLWSVNAGMKAIHDALNIEWSMSDGPMNHGGHMTREVTDAEGTAWTCIQAFAGLGNDPEKTEAARVEGADLVNVVCTPSGGAQSVRLELPLDWGDLGDAELLGAIQSAGSSDTDQ